MQTVFEEPEDVPEGVVVLKGKELERLLGGRLEFAEPIYIAAVADKGIKVKGHSVPDNVMDHGGLSEEEVFIAYLEI